jgi:hypothetical protein
MPAGWFLYTLCIGVNVVANRKIPTLNNDVEFWKYNTAHVGFIV